MAATDMEICFRLGVHGWSDLDVFLPNARIYFRITHIFNSPLIEIAEALLSIEQGETAAGFTLHDEPGHSRWHLQRAHHLLTVTILSHEGNSGDSRDPREIAEFSVNRDFFRDSFLAEFDKIAAQLRYPEFARDRQQGEFPWQPWAELRKRRDQRCGPQKQP